MRRIKIFDTTLRDGEQSPGIALRPDEKAEIARALELLGVDIVEAGFAASSPGDFQGVAAVVDCGDARHRRLACQDDRRRHRRSCPGARRAHRAAGIHVFIATSALHMERKLGLTPPQVLERISWAVAYAAERADEVEFSAEDATRSDRAFLAGACREAIAAGATIVNLPDTVGFTTPGRVRADVRRPARALSRARRRRALGALPRRPRPRRRELARRASRPARRRSSARSTASASGRATQRSRRS